MENFPADLLQNSSSEKSLVAAPRYFAELPGLHSGKINNGNDDNLQNDPTNTLKLSRIARP